MSKEANMDTLTIGLVRRLRDIVRRLRDVAWEGICLTPGCILCEQSRAVMQEAEAWLRKVALMDAPSASGNVPATFQVGDEVEVQPAPEGAGSNWCRVSGRKGVIVYDRGGQLPIGVQFPGWPGGHPLDGRLCGGMTSYEGWWCEKEWLRKVPAPHERVASPRQDATSEAQAQRSATMTAKPVAGATSGSPFVPTIPPTPSFTILGWRPVQFAAGDRVAMGDLEGGVVLFVDAEPRYSVEWPSGPTGRSHIMRIKESNLRPHVPAPVVCAPDGTRCEWGLYRTVEFSSCGWHYCPRCGGKLAKEDA